MLYLYVMTAAGSWLRSTLLQRSADVHHSNLSNKKEKKPISHAGKTNSLREILRNLGIPCVFSVQYKKQTIILNILHLKKKKKLEEV